MSLAQFSGVSAALSEMLPLAEVLEQERISSASWAEAEPAWREEIADAPDLYLEHLAKRRVAEDCLGRSVTPLDEDAAAWVAALSALARTDDPDDARRRMGVSAGDIARLGRKWNRRMSTDPELLERMQKLAGVEQLLPAVKVGPMRLRPFPWSPEGRRATQSIDSSGEQTPRQPPLELAAPTPALQLASFQVREQYAMPQAPAPSVGAVTEWLPPSAVPRAATPFSELEPGAHGVSLSRYVDVVAALQEANANIPQILADRDLTEARWREITAHYEHKFSRQARWSMEFGRLLAAAQKVLRERREEAHKPIARTTRYGSQSEARPVDAVPFSPALPELTVEQYPWVVASIRNSTNEALPETLARFRLTFDSYRALEARWRERMAKDATIAESFARRVQAMLGQEPPRVGPPAAPVLAERRTAVATETLPGGPRDRAALPFARSGAGVLPTATPRATAEVTRDGFTEVPRSSAGQGPPLPFVESPTSRRMPLDRYAELSAILEREGDPTATFRRLAIAPEDFVATIHAYSAIFADDPSLEQEYKRLVALAAARLRKR